MIKWLLCLAVLTPQDGNLLIPFKDVKVSNTRAECEELKKDPKWVRIKYTYEKFSGAVAVVVCAGFPDSEVET